MFRATKTVLLALSIALASAACQGGSAPDHPDGDTALATIVVMPASATLGVGQTRAFVAEGRTAGGAAVPSIAFTWRTSDVAVATIDDRGIATGVGIGTARIAARSGAIASAEVTVTVTASPSTGPSSEDLIDAALAAGTLDADAALAYKVFAAFDDPRLPSQYHGDDSGIFDTDVLDRLNERFDSLPASLQSDLGPFLMRPAAIGSWADRRATTRAPQLTSGRPTCRGESSGWTTAGPSTANVRVWYRFENSIDRALAELISNEIETRIWPKLIDPMRVDGLKLMPPLSDSSIDGCFGGDARLDVYIVHEGFPGLTVPEGFSVTQNPSYILINVDKVTDEKLPCAAAHELMHVIQNRYKTQAVHDRYGWLHDALANWAIDAVYGRDPMRQGEQDHADCFLNSTALPLEDRSWGYCSRWAAVRRDYGAYLLMQYIAKTKGENAIKAIIEARATVSTSVEAVDAALGQQLRNVWPEFAKALWNREPIDRKPASFRQWDDLKIGAKARDDAGDLGGQPEVSLAFEPEQLDLSTRYYHVTFSDPEARSLLFYNGFFDQQKAGKAIKVFAVWRDAMGNWQEEDWTPYEFVGLCRDFKNQRTDDLTIIITNGEWSAGGGGRVIATKAPYLKRSNLGCSRYTGTVTMIDKFPTWSGLGKQVTSNVVFERIGDALDLQVPAFPDTLRIVGAIPMLLTGTDCTIVESYTSGCTISAGPFTVPLPGQMSGGGFIYVNAFPELRSTDSTLQTLLAMPARAYLGSIGDSRTYPVTVSGPGCPTSETHPIGAILTTGELSNNNVPITPPIAVADGKLTATFTFLSAQFTWLLTPSAQP